MSEVIDLGNLDSVAELRAGLVEDLPHMLTIADATEQKAALEQGRNSEVVDWFRGYVTAGAHGINAGVFGLTPEQTREFNPIAQRNGMMAPLELWKPGDEMPQGAKVGDIKEYSVLPVYDTLDGAIFKAKETIVVDALFDGTIGRIKTALGAAVRSESVKNGGVGEVVVLTGMRAIKAGEGKTGLYRQFLPEGTDSTTPVDVAFPKASDACLAILGSECSRFEMIDELEDPDAGNKPENRLHPTLGGRTWILRHYDAVHAETGARLLVTVVNGEPITPTGGEMNRDKREPAPVAAATLLDYLQYSPQESRGDDRNLCVSYAHLARIAANLIKETRREDGSNMMGRVMLVGSMPQQASWNKMTESGKHNGGTLGYKEIFPLITALNGLLGRSVEDLER